MTLKYLEAPATKPDAIKHKDPCIIISFDVEGCHADDEKRAVDGSTISLGGAAFLWPERQRVPQSLREIVFYRNIKPSLPTNGPAQKFFRDHPHAWKATQRDPVEPFAAGLSFLHWLGHLMRNHNRRLVLMSEPHDYDGAALNHLLRLTGHHWEGLQKQSADLFRQPVQWVGAVEAIATLRDIGVDTAKGDYLRFLPKLQHIADLDSLDQGNAFLAASI